MSDMFGALSDDELILRCESGELTAQAHAIALREALARGLNPHAPKRRDDAPYWGDFTTLRTHLTPTEAHLYQACLEQAGIPAVVGDANMVQAYSLIFSALGGASLRVPADLVAHANAVLAAWARGDFALGDDLPS